ncbi:MAG: hypothetical protein NTY45_04980, partial [Elusimicrobia bacterium]|nr:hypothetical protein [Elusimicrobiota bacterium]
TRIGVESTIITFIKGRPVLLRPGGLPLEEIEKLAGTAARAPGAGRRAPAAPGCLKKHYAPAAKLKLIAPGQRVRAGGAAAYLAFSKRPAGKFRAVQVLSAGGDLREAAAALFSALHKLESSGARTIYAEKVPPHGLGRAIMDRLKRAAA